MVEFDFEIIGRFHGDVLDKMRFNGELRKLLRLYCIDWKRTDYVEKQFKDNDFR